MTIAVWLLAFAVAGTGLSPAQVLVSTNATWSYRKGTSEASQPAEAWRLDGFDDAEWGRGEAPFYYDTGNGYQGNTVLGDMRNGYTSVFLRRAFVVGGVADLGTLDLRYYCDDGFALWINGVPVTTANKSDGDYRFDSLATASASEPLNWLGSTLTNPQNYLREGANQLAVQAFNVSRTSSDFVFEMELVARPRDAMPPTLSAIDPSPGTVGSLNAITVTFSEPVTGLGFSDLLINERPAAGVIGSGTRYTFSLNAPAYGEVRVRWDPGAAITDFGNPPNRFDTAAPGAQWSYQLVDATPPSLVRRSPAPGSTVRRLTEIEVLFSEPVTGVDAADLLVNGLPAAGVTGSGPGPYRFAITEPEAGRVLVDWVADPGILDEANPPNAFQGMPWSCWVDPAYTPPSVRITEFLTGYSGDAGLRDEDDELQDWIELQNRSDQTVNLGGWSLTDDADLPGKWVFPDHLIAPGAFVVVFASGKDRKPEEPGGRLHANFKLGSDGEYLALFNAELPRVKVVEFAPAYPPQRQDHSFGDDSEDRLRYFQRPTPGASNGVSAIVGLVPKVAVSVPRGVFDDPFELHLTCALDGADIRYTTDGSEPSLVNGLTYDGPMTVSRTTMLRAAAFQPNHLPSVSVTHSYLFPAQAARQTADAPGLPSEWIDTQGRPWTADYGMDPEIVDAPAYRARVVDSLLALPILSLVTRPGDMFDNSNGIYPKSQARGPSWERPASAEFIEPWAGGGTAQINCGVQMQGNSVRDPVKTAKHAFRLLFKGDYGPAKFRYRVFPDAPVEEFDTITLRADFNNSWMHWNGEQRPRGQRVRDAWMKDSHRAMGGLSSHSRFYHLYVNGLYWGVYDATERPDAAFAASYFGGRKEDFDVVNEGQLVDGSMAAYNTMRSLGNLADNTQYERLKQYLDVPAYIDYVLLHFYTGHEDWFTDKNWYAIRRRAPGEGFRYQCWDGELMLNSPTRNIVTRDDQPTNLHPKLRENAQYRLDFADRVHRHFFNGGALTPAAVAARYDRWAGQVGPAMIAESARWGDYRRDVHPYSSGPYLLYTPDQHFATERARLMTSYFPVRTDNVLGQLKAAGLYPTAAAPGFQPVRGPVEPGTRLTLTAPAGTIYYTTDGSDPRTIYTGEPAPGAQVSSGPLVLTRNLWVKARTRVGDEWSALREEVFEVDRLGVPLAITEIHYHPRGGDPYEFVEIHNAGATPVEASGFSLRGVQFVFPPGSLLAPGQTVVIASALSPSSFALRYPGVLVLGSFSGTLDNGGERLALLDREGRIVDSVDFRDADGWPEAADGDGPSLERIDPFSDPDAPAGWRASALPDGTPGLPTRPPALGALRLNEVMAANAGSVTNGSTPPDWLELHNAGPEEVDLAGWSLSEAGRPGAFTFPAGTRVASGGFLVVWCDAQTTAPGLHTGFALDRAGETVWLFDDRGAVADALTFGLQLPDLTASRLGDAGVWSLGRPTPGAANQPQPMAEPTHLALNEWLANPVPGADDWVEIYNRDPLLPASLRNLTFATTAATFQLRALSFVSPAGHVVLIADERSGPDHLDFKLPASGNRLTLRDATGRVLDEIEYGLQVEGASQGRLPDGADGPWKTFTAPTPGVGNATVAPPAAPHLEVVAAGDDFLLVRIQGEVGAEYLLQGSSDLRTWETLRSATPTSLPVEWSVPIDAAIPHRFLRVRLGP